MGAVFGGVYFFSVQKSKLDGWLYLKAWLDMKDYWKVCWWWWHGERTLETFAFVSQFFAATA